MATTLPGSPYVESSDLVANYPAVSESLAERVDLVGVLPFASATARTTALPTPTDGQYSYLQDTNSTEYYNGSAWIAAGIAPGLVHINTTTFSAVSSVSFNDVFTSSYDNYLIISEIVISVNANVDYRLRLSGADATGLNYDRQLLYVFGANANALASANQSAGRLTYIAAGESAINDMIVSNPNLPKITLFSSTGGCPVELNIITGDHDLTTAYDGITYFPTAGTISGTIRIYGYKNS